jgi:RNA recognition motif-containing protein
LSIEVGGDKAIAEMNGKDFNGRVLTVNEARPMASRDSGRVSFKQY